MRLAIIGVLSACLLGVAPFAAMADEQTEKALEERVKKLEQLVEQLTKHEAKEAKEEGQEKAKEAKEKEEKKAQQPLSITSAGGGELIYAKPFVSSPKATLGGYMDLQYRTFSSSNPTGVEQPGTGLGSSSFDQQRFVPFIYADITDRLKVAAEVEFEHGIRTVSNGDNNGIEVTVEFATIDYRLKEPLNLRAGIILLPVGRFNELHDSPLNDLSDRPLVATAIIPSTLSETGAGFYGTFYPSRLSKLDYEVYVTQGFDGYKKDGTPVITPDAGLQDAKQRVSTTVDDGLDNNNGKAVVGRLGFSPFLGVEVGGSGYFGSYDPASKRPLSITAVDWTFQHGPFDLIGEAAWVYVRDNNRTLDGGFAFDANGRPLTRRMDGFYVQGNYHFLPDALRRWGPAYFTEASSLTAVVRWDQVNTNSEVSDTARQRLTLGLNYRPIRDTVFKMDYQFNYEDGKNNRIRNDGLVLSVATYF